FADMARAWNHGEFPLLSPYSWICGNLAGEFQYGVFSVFINALIVCVWKLPLTFSQQAAVVSIAHLAVLSAGAFLLARGRKLSIPLSTLVALVASLNGWIICWGAGDWLGALRAVFEIGTTDTASPARISPGALARLTRTWPLLAGVTIGFGLAAPAWLALLDYVHGSARESLHPSAHWQWLVPWNAWPGLILP